MPPAADLPTAERPGRPVRQLLTITSPRYCQPHDHYRRKTRRSATYTPFWNPTGPCWLILARAADGEGNGRAPRVTPAPGAGPLPRAPAAGHDHGDLWPLSRPIVSARTKVSAITRPQAGLPAPRMAGSPRNKPAGSHRVQSPANQEPQPCAIEHHQQYRRPARARLIAAPGFKVS
jgi:hypothetical protein